MLLENLPSKEVAGEVLDTIKDNNFTSIATMNVELTRKLVRRLRLCPLLWLQEKVVFNANITGNMQVIVAGFNEKRTQESSSGKTSADESDEEATHGLAECEIQESVEDDVQKSIYVGTSEAVVAGRSNHSKLNTC